MRIQVAAQELLDRETLIDAALSAHVTLAVSEKSDRNQQRSYAERLGRLRDLVAFRVGELRAAQETRGEIERRYLDGHAALFPTRAAAWDDQVQRTETLAAMACRLAEIDGVSPGRSERRRRYRCPCDRARR